MATAPARFRPKQFPPPEFPPRKVARFAKTPLAVFPVILGAIGLVLALRRGFAVLDLPQGPVDLAAGLVLALWIFAALAYVAKLAQRILWSIPVAMVVLVVLGRTGDLWRALVTPRLLGMALVTAVLVGANWGIYLYAILSGRALDAALGSFINPLFSILLGALALTASVIALSEMLSNTALVAALLPVVGAIAEGTGLPVARLAAAVALAASCTFMLPAGTPPNSLVFSSGLIRVAQMMRYGLLMNLLSTLLVALLVWIWAPVVF